MNNAVAMTVATPAGRTSIGDPGVRLHSSRRDAVLTVLGIQVVVHLLFIVDSAARGHPPGISDIPLKILLFVAFSLLACLLYLVIETAQRWHAAIQLGVILLACVVLGALFNPILIGIQMFFTDRPVSPWPWTFRSIQIGTLPYLFTAAGLLAMNYYGRVRERERQLVRSQAMVRDAELLALRYQIDPHFLFNALNSISTLVLARRNDEAETMLLRLSGFFRQTLELERSGNITLGEELELLQAYLEVEQYPVGGSMTLDIDAPAGLLETAVPAMILQPLVENAVKHGTRGGVIRLCARAEQGRLVIELLNGVADADRRAGTGTGLRNVRDRLSSIYGPAGALDSDRPAENVYRVRLALSLPTSAERSGPGSVRGRKQA